MNRWQLAEENESAKDTGRSPQTGEKNPDAHSITENRSGGHFNQREWARRMTITEITKEQNVKNSQQTDTPTSGSLVAQAMWASVCVKELMHGGTHRGDWHRASPPEKLALVKFSL